MEIEEVKERPILFSGPMVRAILEGRKTQTRRIVKRPPVYGGYGSPLHVAECPYGKPGDRLWVKRTHYRFGHWEPRPGVKTAAGRMKWKFVPDSEEVLFNAPSVFRKGRHHKDPHTPAWHKRCSLFMPRELAEILLEVTSVRVERLQDISALDCLEEGVLLAPPSDMPDDAVAAYRDLWQSINGVGSWDANPFCWVIEFKRVQP